MPEPKLSEYFTRECSAKFGIGPKHALQACSSPDQTSVLEQDDLVLRIHSKLIGEANPPFHLLVVEQVAAAFSIVHCAFKVYPDLSPDLSVLTPDGILERLAERFGLPIRIGATEARFIWAAHIPISNPNDVTIVSGLAPRGASYAQQMFLRINAGLQMTADVAVAFCIDTDSYTAWLRQHKM